MNFCCSGFLFSPLPPPLPLLFFPSSSFLLHPFLSPPFSFFPFLFLLLLGFSSNDEHVSQKQASTVGVRTTPGTNTG